MSVRQYSVQSLRQLVYYWSQNGNVLLPDGKEDMAQVNEYAWLSMLWGRSPPERVSRLSVLLAAPATGDAAAQQRTLDTFAGSLAAEMYRGCPWAKPQTIGDR